MPLPRRGGDETAGLVRQLPRAGEVVALHPADAQGPQDRALAAVHGRSQRLLQEGAFAYLTKPLEMRRFLHVVDAALSGSPEPAES
ncbi:MAG: hypothetical protein KY434_09560 [Actinobacteria bacterium]|nr:hypothetical protein [Actinomycetota bacterium]